MRIKELFTVPEGKKITEKIFTRVLISSICSILLCMGCLAGTTWALFSVSIKNTGNEIQIGEPSVTVTIDGENISSGTEEKLTVDSYDVQMQRTHDTQDSFAKKSTIYVTLTVDGTPYVYAVSGDPVVVEITAKKECTLSWTASWSSQNAESQANDAIIIEADEITEPSESEPEASSEPEESSEPSESAETTEGTTETTVPSSSEPEESSDPSESSEPNEPVSSEEAIDPSDSNVN